MNCTKKISTLVMTAVMIASFACVFTACGNDDDPIINNGEEEQTEEKTDEMITEETVTLSAEDFTEYGYLKDGVYYKLNHDKLTATITAVADGVTRLTPPKGIIFNGYNYTMPTVFGNEYIYAPSVETLYLSARYTSIEPLLGFTALKKIVVSTDNENLKSEDGLVLSKDGQKLLYVPICSPTPLKIPTSVSIIANRAIYYNTTLSELTIPANIKEVRGGITNNQFETLTIESNNIEIYSECFARNENLKKVNLSNGIKTVGNALFMFCKNLEQINFPDGVTSIGKLAFASCKLTEINLPSTLTYIVTDAFRDCATLHKVYYNASSFTSPDKNALDIASMTELHFTHKGEVTGFTKSSFSQDVYSKCRLFIPKGYKSSYDKEPFSLFKNVTEE